MECSEAVSKSPNAVEIENEDEILDEDILEDMENETNDIYVMISFKVCKIFGCLRQLLVSISYVVLSLII